MGNEEKQAKGNHNIIVEKFTMINRDSLKAYARVTIDGIIRIHGVKVAATKADNTLYVAMPQIKGKGAEAKWFDVVQVIDTEFKNELQTAVLNAFTKEVKA